VNSRFRTQDGTCNNVNNPTWGAINRPFNRLLAAAYNDGVNSPRFVSRAGSNLQNARVISVTIHPDSSALNSRITNMVPQFGQFLDHDITLTPEASTYLIIEFFHEQISQICPRFLFLQTVNVARIQDQTQRIAGPSRSPQEIHSILPYPTASTLPDPPLASVCRL
jgi:hypothetical protein